MTGHMAKRCSPGVVRALATAGCLAATVTLLAQQTTPVATIVLRNGRILTMDDRVPEAQAIALRRDTILAVGTNDEIGRHAGPYTRVIDLQGQLAIPGFIESHGHFLGLGESLTILNLTRLKTWDEAVTMVAEAVKKAKPGEWIVGRGWHQEKWSAPPRPSVEGFPTHEAISKVSPDNPVVLEHASGHATFANARAMELAGVTGKTPDPPGGEILKDDRGRPTGIFRERGSDLLDRAREQWQRTLTAKDRETASRRHITLAGQHVVSKGITTFHDAGATFETIDLYRRVVDEGRMLVRLWVMVRDAPEQLSAKLPSYRSIGYGNGRLTVRAIKLAIDGALGTRGAWLLEPYSDQPSSTGLNTVPLDVARETARLAIEQGYQLCVHAIGDRANRETLNLMAQAFASYPDKTDLRWRIEHAQHLHPDDVPRFVQLGVIASMQGVHATSDAPFVVPRLGARRAEEGAYVWQKLLKSGAVVINGTDAPVEDVDPVANYYASVTRKRPDGTTFHPEQRMTRMEALKSYTLAPAFAAFEDATKGSLAPGKLADITVLTRDITKVPDDQISGTTVAYTIVGGKVVYQAAATARPSARP
jgi:predicted amidohydrolase YtcJ